MHLPTPVLLDFQLSYDTSNLIVASSLYSKQLDSLSVMHFLAFLIAASSVSIAVLFLEDSDQINLPPLESLPPGSLSLGPTPGNGYPPLSDSSSLNPTTPGNNPSPFNVDQNIVQLENLGDIQTEAQTHPDDSYMICELRRSNGPKRRKRQLSCPPKGLVRDEQDRTEPQRKKDALSDADQAWIWKQIGSEAWKFSDWEMIDILIEMSRPGKEACQTQIKEEGAFTRHNSLCCLGPEEEMTAPFTPWPILGNRLARRHEIPKNVFGCEPFIEGRPFCARKEQRYCCGSADYLDVDDWGFKGLDCVHMLWNPDDSNQTR